MGDAQGHVAQPGRALAWVDNYGGSAAAFGSHERGAMVFWAAKPAEVGKKPEGLTAVNDSELRGFAVGDESTVGTLKIPQIKGAGSVYWIIFSSNRADIPAVPSKHTNPAMPNGSLVQVSQLYITAVVQTEDGIKTFPAIYLGNQPTDTLNTTPAWESFQLPPAL